MDLEPFHLDLASIGCHSHETDRRVTRHKSVHPRRYHIIEGQRDDYPFRIGMLDDRRQLLLIGHLSDNFKLVRFENDAFEHIAQESRSIGEDDPLFGHRTSLPKETVRATHQAEANYSTILTGRPYDGYHNSEYH